MTRFHKVTGGVAGAALVLAAAFGSAASPLRTRQKTAPLAAPLGYNRDIRPILAENCFPCHGPDSAARKAGLRLDRFADAAARGALVPGDPLASGIIQRVFAKGALQMPPAAGHKSLTETQKALLVRWIDEGGRYEIHWSYQPPRMPAIPQVKNTAWVRNTVDRFILAKLEAAGLQPAPEADRRTLARRLALDLTGLPPEPADVEAFVADKRPDAYEKLVDKFLASPQWGEHRGRYWLDAARYADTHGIHFDNYREIWAYRDWVISAFNRNMPFDQFTIEQLAGDLLPNPTLEQRVATGFTRCNITTNEGGAIDEEYRVLYARDRTETAAQIWLGTTAGCAVCHDHKFDPVTQRDFYSLSAFFNNTTQNAMDGNIKDTPPILMVPQVADRPRFAQLQTELSAAKKAVEDRRTAARPDFDTWLAQPKPPVVAAPTAGLIFHAPLNEGTGGKLAVTRDGQAASYSAEGAGVGWIDGPLGEKAYQKKPGGSVALPDVGDFEADKPFSFGAWVRLPANAGGAIFGRMDESKDFIGWDLWTEGNRVGTHIIHAWPSDALKVVTREALSADTWHHVLVAYDGSRRKEGIHVYVDGVEKPTDPQAESLKGSIRTTVPLKLGQRNTTAAIEGVGVQDIRLYSRCLTPSDAAQLQGMRVASLLARGPEKLSKAQKDDLFAWWLGTTDTNFKVLSDKLAALQQEDGAIRARGTTAYVASEKSGEPEAYILARGEYDKRRDKVGPNTPSSLPPLPSNLPKNRLGLAKWLLLPNHPLTTRVTVNRYWQELFGTGLVRSAGDFGISGELPSHPELLDWLALDFQRDWNIKRAFKQLVMSATYRQAVVLTPEKKAKDPANRLLSRGPRFRMDGEMVRDYALAASGLLVKKLGGPSVKPYQPDGVWEAVAMIGSNTRDYRRDSGENLYRRSLYTFWKRAAPPASMEIFNAPNRETCVVKRERTNTPLQALVTLNDIQMVEAARNLAERAMKASRDPMDYMARRVLARPLTTTERVILDFNQAELEAYYRVNTKDAQQLIAYGESMADGRLSTTELAAWTMVANQLLNLDEALNK